MIVVVAAVVTTVVLEVLAAAPSMAVAPAGDPCGVDPPRSDRALPATDFATARAYREVGDEERAAGDLAAAAIAYREAVRRAPGDSRARSALAVVCASKRRVAAKGEAPSGDEDRSGRSNGESERLAHALPEPASDQASDQAFDEGLRRMERGDRSRAIAAFEALRLTNPDPSASLLEGICAYELGRDRLARSRLLEAKADPELAGAALFFLGLIAFRDGDTDAASSLLSSAGTLDARLTANSAAVQRLVRRDGRLVLSALLQAGGDSNVELTPDGTATGGGSADGNALMAMTLLAQPYGTSGPYLRASGQYRQQVKNAAYNLGDVTAAAGERIGPGTRYLIADYSYDYVALGQASLLSAHRLLGSGRLTFAPISVGATYFARFESFSSSSTRGYSGLRHDAELEIDWHVEPRYDLIAGYHVGRDATRDAAFSYLEQGPFAGFRFSMDRPLRIGVEARLTRRRYDAVDPDLGIERTDRYVDGAAVAEMDVSDHWTLRTAGTARRALSNLAAFQYTKLTATIGVAYVAGIL